MIKQKNTGGIILSIAFVAAVALFGFLYSTYQIPTVEEPPKAEADVLETWSPDSSAANGHPLEENKDIYKEGVDTNVYDVYITAFPTKDEKGKILTLKDFALHTPRNHDYNPVLKCHIDIKPQGVKPGLDLGTDTIPNATIRVRGNSSRGDAYKSYKVNLYEDAQPFQGQMSLNINKHTEDDMKIITKLCTDLLRDVPDICSYNTTFMRVWMQDASKPRGEREYEYQGLYTQTEQPNKTYLRRRGLSADGTLYKARDFSFMPREELVNVDDSSYSEKEFEKILGIREGEDHRKLLEMVGAVNDYTTDFESTFNKYFNEDNYLTFLATSILFGAEDILNHNFLLYNPSNSETWYFIPWDFDSNLDIHSTYHMEPSLAGGQKLNMIPLHKRFFRMEGSLEKLEKKIDEVYKLYFNEDKVNKLLESYKPVMELCMPYMPDIELTKYPIDTYWDVVMTVPDIIRENLGKFKFAFQHPTPMFVSIPKEDKQGRLCLSWEPSYSYQNRPITYNVRISTDYHMENVVFEKQGIAETDLNTDLKLTPGTYYLDVRAVDSAGHEQVSLEHYEQTGISFEYIDGLMQFELK